MANLFGKDDKFNIVTNESILVKHRSNDYIGNKNANFTTMGAVGHGSYDRQLDDYYATEPRVLELLLEHETFQHNVWENSCGGGHLAEVLKAHGYSVRATDLYDRGYGESGIDFLQQLEPWDGDIVMNPPYKLALQFVQHSLALTKPGAKIAAFLKLTFLEGNERRKFFDKCPPRFVYVSTNRIMCALNGDFDKFREASAIAYAWYIWENGWYGEPAIRWFN